MMCSRMVLYRVLEEGQGQACDVPSQALTAEYIVELQKGFKSAMLTDTFKTYADLLKGLLRKDEKVELSTRIQNRFSASGGYGWYVVLDLTRDLQFETVTDREGKDVEVLIIKAEVLENEQGGALSSDAIVDRLTETYADSIVTATLESARAPDPGRFPDTSLPLREGGCLYEDIGKYFSVEGRKDSLKVVVAGICIIYKTFLGREDLSYVEWSRGVFFLMLIAYPGAGKTTFGNLLRVFLVRAWREADHGCIGQVVRKYLKTKSEMEGFYSMIEASLEYNLSFTHTLWTEEDGSVRPIEKNLQPAQILALRCLFSSFGEDTPDMYDAFLKQLSGKKFPGLLQNITLKEVIAVIRRVLNLKNQKIMIFWFIDEINRAVGMIGPSRTASTSNTTISWYQQCMSAFVRALYTLKDQNVFPLICGSTTRHSAGNLKFTATGHAKSILIPLSPLGEDEVNQVMEVLYKRLQLTVGVGSSSSSNDRLDAPAHLKLLLSLVGGMPRLTGYALTAMITKIEKESIFPNRLLSLMQNRAVPRKDVKKMVQNLDFMVTGRIIGEGFFKQDKKLDVLFKSMAISVLQQVVRRCDIVLPGSEDTWGDLESQGIVSLSDHCTPMNGSKKRAHSRRMYVEPTGKVAGRIVPDVEDVEEVPDVQGYTSFDDVPLVVGFCPLLISTILEVKGLRSLPFVDDLNTPETLLPSCTDTDWKVKEEDDLLIFLFKLYLLQQACGRNRFTLRDVFPYPVFIPGKLTNLIIPDKLGRPGRMEQGMVRAALAKISQGVAVYGMGPTNSGKDSFFATVGEDGELFVILFESKFRSGCQVASNYVEIRDQQMKVVKNFFSNRHTDYDFVYIYITDAYVADAVKQEHQEQRDFWDSRLMIVDRDADETVRGPLELLKAVRHLQYLYQLTA